MLDTVVALVVILSEQKLYAISDSGSTVYVAPVGTGKAGHATPAGKFSINSKYAVTDLVGKGYRVPSRNVMCFIGNEYCIHPTPYPDVALGTTQSRGCIRTSETTAKWLFDHTDINTPIHIIQ
jgi:lipoprotein-anchoring transpeptidase ErfK/SrfK